MDKQLYKIGIKIEHFGDYTEYDADLDAYVRPIKQTYAPVYLGRPIRETDAGYVIRHLNYSILGSVSVGGGRGYDAYYEAHYSKHDKSIKYAVFESEAEAQAECDKLNAKAT